MKKYLCTLVAVLLCLGTYAQVKGDKTVGLNISYGTEISNIGFGVKGQYNFTDAIRAEASFDYFLKKDGMSMWDINVNVHYLFSVAKKLKLYPLIGLTYTNWKAGYSTEADDDPDVSKYSKSDPSEDDESVSDHLSRFGVNLGGGISYEVIDKLLLNAEVKYQLISDFGQAVFSVGVAYKF